MATLTIRNLSEATRHALKERAAHNNRSMEAEVRDILDAAIGADTDFVSAWIGTTAALRGEFEVPTRANGREIDLS